MAKRASSKAKSKTRIPSKKTAKNSKRASRPRKKKPASLAEVTNHDGTANGEEVMPAKLTPESLQALAVLKDKAESGDETALKSLLEVVVNFGQHRQAKDHQKSVARQCKERLEQEEAGLQEAIERAIPQGSVQETVEANEEKLAVISTRWQDLQDVKQANEQQKRDARKAVAEWANKLDRSIQDSAQLTLGFD